MSDELAFVEEIRAHPDDDDRRLVYADFLEDEGDPRGELIRTQIELQRLPPAARERVGLLRREDELLAAHGESWLEPLRKLGAEGLSIRCFERGLIERVRMPARLFVRHAQALCAAAPALSCVELRAPQEAAEALVEMDWPAQVTGLDLNAGGVTAEFIDRLSPAPWTRRLRTLALQFNQLGDAGAAALARWDGSELRHLKLGMNNIGADGLAQLCRWTPFWSVESLALNVNPLGDAGMRQLGYPAQRVTPDILEESERSWRALDLASTRLTDAGLQRLLGFGELRGVERLNLRANQIGSSGWRQLAETLGNSLLWVDTRNNKAPLPDDIASRFLHGTIVR